MTETPSIAAGVTRGLSLDELTKAMPAHLVWLAGVLEDEVERGRMELDEHGVFAIVAEMFEPAVLAALAAWETPAA